MSRRNEYLEKLLRSKDERITALQIVVENLENEVQQWKMVKAEEMATYMKSVEFSDMSFDRALARFRQTFPDRKIIVEN